MKLIHKLEIIWEFIRYDIPNFVRNVWMFRKFLLNYKWWDYHYVLEGLSTSLAPMADGLEKRGNEIESSRMKKVKQIRRALEILDNIKEDKYIEMAEKELGNIIYKEWMFIPIEGTDSFSLNIDETDEEQTHNSRIYCRSNEIQEQEWEELFYILKGNVYNDDTRSTQVLSSECDKNSDEKTTLEWDDWFDGSGLRGWWD